MHKDDAAECALKATQRVHSADPRKCLSKKSQVDAHMLKNHTTECTLATRPRYWQAVRIGRGKSEPGRKIPDSRHRESYEASWGAFPSNRAPCFCGGRLLSNRPQPTRGGRFWSDQAAVDLRKSRYCQIGHRSFAGVAIADDSAPGGLQRLHLRPIAAGARAEARGCAWRISRKEKTCRKRDLCN